MRRCRSMWLWVVDGMAAVSRVLVAGERTRHGCPGPAWTQGGVAGVSSAPG